MKKKIFFSLLAAVLAISLIVSWAPKGTCAAKKIVWKFQTFTAIKDYPEPWLEFFAKRVKERTNGQLELQLFHAGELGFNGPEFLRLLRDGMVDCALLPTPYLTGDFPLFEVTNLPFLLGSPDEHIKAAPKFLPIISKKLEKEWNVVVFCPVPVFAQTLQTIKPINSMDDLKGLKIRTSGVGQADLWKAAGASPVTMPQADCYSSLQRGVIEGINIALSLHYTIKLYEVAKYVYTIDVNSPEILIAGSEKSYKALPLQLQRALHDAGDDAVPFILAGGAKTVANDIENLKKKGCIVQDLPPDIKARLRSLGPPIWDACVKRLSSRVPEAEAQQLIDVIRKALNK